MAFNINGGAEIQIANTMRSLNSIDASCHTKAFNPWEDRIQDFDIMHIFNPLSFPTESLTMARFAIENKVRVAVSPIYFQSDEMRMDLQSKRLHGSLWKSAILFRPLIVRNKLLQYLDPYHDFSRLLEIADAILPNTEAEMNSLKSHFKHIGDSQLELVPNGVNHSFADGNPSLFKQEYGICDFVLYVGRIEKRKNILRLIRAFSNTELETSLVIIGKAHDDLYLSLCKKESDERTLFLPAVPHDSPMLKSVYKCAKVFALPSYYETPGLAALEAGLAGANIVITARGGTREYFGEYARYIDPLDRSDIEKALIEQYKSPRKSNLSEHISKNFTWEIVAAKTLNVYHEMLA